jgi:hypothetical protein
VALFFVANLEGKQMTQELLLADYISIEEAAQQPGMPCARTLRRMIERRQLPVTYLGRRPLIHIPTFLEILREREVKVLRGRR